MGFQIGVCKDMFCAWHISTLLAIAMASIVATKNVFFVLGLNCSDSKTLKQ